VREIPGKDDSAEILRYFRDAGDANAETEATPWRAAFAGAMLKRGGHTGTGSLLARSYLDWRIGLEQPRRTSAFLALRPRVAEARRRNLGPRKILG
jgi:hypothetical protein